MGQGIPKTKCLHTRGHPCSPQARCCLQSVTLAEHWYLPLSWQPSVASCLLCSQPPSHYRAGSAEQMVSNLSPALWLWITWVDGWARVQSTLTLRSECLVGVFLMVKATDRFYLSGHFLYKKILFLIMRICVCLYLCMRVQCPQRTEGGAQCLGAVVIGICDLPRVGAGNQTPVLCKKSTYS